MTEPWLYLLHRYGNETSSPTTADLAETIREIYHEDLPGMTEGDYEEHGAASLRFGYDEGPMFVLEFTRGGIARFEEWADQDYETEICPPKELSSLSENTSLELWVALAQGDISKVRAAFAAAT
jgi:hypothetical protein